MTIADPEHRFRLMFKVFLSPYEGEQPFYSAAQDNLLGVIQLVQAIARSPLHPHIRSYVIQEEIVTVSRDTFKRWETLDYTDWCDLAWPRKT